MSTPAPFSPDNTQFVSPLTPRYRVVFYSSIPPAWTDDPATCITCLACARDEFAPPATAKIYIDDKPVN